eukprot:6196136-Pleurochrysis_carterae.AAC.1
MQSRERTGSAKLPTDPGVHTIGISMMLLIPMLASQGWLWRRVLKIGAYLKAGWLPHDRRADLRVYQRICTAPLATLSSALLNVRTAKPNGYSPSEASSRTRNSAFRTCRNESAAII